MAATLETDYFVISPGDVFGTDDRITITGTESYDTEGEIGFTTVNLKPATYLEYFFAKRDPDVLIVPAVDILGDGTRQENTEFNLQLMDDSKNLAAAVAIEHLGIDAVQCEGVLIEQAIPGFPAAEVMERGDELLGINDVKFDCWSDAVESISSLSPGDEIEIEILRHREVESDHVVIETETVVLVEFPIHDEVTGELVGSDPERPFLGISAVDRVSFDMPYEVDIKTDDIGGPSAGLALTLAVIDQLTPEDITGGRLVATTGTIRPDGFIGAVGGVPQKVIAAENDGAAIFLAPASEIAEAREWATTIEIYEANTVSEALAVLEATGGEPIEGITEPVLP